MKTGFLGLGNMGRPMAQNLLAQGHELTVWNRSPEAARALEGHGARVAADPADLVENREIVCICVASIEASRKLLLGPEGLIARAESGTILIDHGTVDVATSQDCHRAARERGVDFLDAPISGGPQGAEDASLSIMTGGEEEVFERARPVLEAMGRTVRRMGPAGAGTATKLCNQLLVGLHSLASCEALALARRAGVELEPLLEVLSQSWGQSRMLERNGPVIARGEFGPSAVPLRNLHKDLAIIVEHGREAGLSLSGAREALRVYSALLEAGKGSHDIVAASTLVDPELP